MPKKRKTRKQKILTDQKIQGVSEMIQPVTSAPPQGSTQVKQVTPVTGTFTLPNLTENTTQKPQTSNHFISITLNEYGYLPTDLLRTTVLSGAIIITELLIRLLFVH